MAYVIGSGSRSEDAAQKRRGADLAARQMEALERELQMLTAPGRAAFMACFIPGVTKAAEAVTAGVSGAKAAPAVLSKSAGAGGRSFVSSRKRRATCPKCLKGIKAKFARCPRCGTRNPRPGPKALKALKAVAAAEGRGAFLSKSAGEQGRDQWMAKMRSCPGPARREFYWQMANPDVYGGQGRKAAW